MNLLMDDVFKVIAPEGPRRVSLPALLEALGEDRVDSLAGVQRHQADIIHIFLCYLAGAVLAREEKSDPKQSEAFWREGLRRLAGREDDCTWELIVEDPTKPAFMQPPAPSRIVFDKEYKPKAETPDALDVLQTAKNHEVKVARAGNAEMEAWALALISFQNASGFLGQGNYGIARMNGGFGSRVCVGWRAGRRPGEWFGRDLGVLMQHRSVLLRPPYSYSGAGKTLLWQEPWDGGKSLSLSDLDPFFIEVARRVRLVARGEGILALGATSSCARIEAKKLSGNLGDPWTPINEEKNSALTPSSAGLTSKLLRDLIFQDKYKPAPMQLAPSGGGSGWFCVSVLVRGQGTTDGFHEAAIRIPERARPILFGGGGKRDRLAEMSKHGLEMAGDFQRKVLRPALYVLMEGGPEPNAVDYQKREVSSWVGSMARAFESAWQPLYFDWLWTTLDEPDDLAAKRPWFESLKKLSQATLEKAMAKAPARNARGYRAVTRANNAFFGGLYKNFRDYMEEKK